MVSSLRVQLREDIADGAERGVFPVLDVDLSASLAAGAITGLARDIPVGLLPDTKIDAAVEHLLRLLGIRQTLAESLATEPVNFPEAPATPLRWLALTAPEQAFGESA